MVLECGVGGRYDSTNIIPDPECAVITSIGLDHVEMLGNTTPLICAEKAEIIKPKTKHVVVGPTCYNDFETFAQIRSKTPNPYKILDSPDIRVINDNITCKILTSVLGIEISRELRTLIS